MIDPEVLAEMFHEIYEELAPQFGYETRSDSAKHWEDIPESNKLLMVATCKEIIDKLFYVSPASSNFRHLLQDLESEIIAATLSYNEEQETKHQEAIDDIRFKIIMSFYAQSAPVRLEKLSGD